MAEITLKNFSKRALRRVSPIYENSTFIRYLYNSVGVKFDPIRDLFLTLREQSFIDTVDWGIEYQEHKYSLEPRPDLTLEERRKRLGLKARQHFPINPARLEKTIYDAFETATYLDESRRGWIQLFFNYATEENCNALINYLLDEKPAHLFLNTTIHIPVYHGTGGDGEPGGGYGGGGGTPVIIPTDPPVPKTEEEKKKFPRVFVGGVHHVMGSAKIGLAHMKGWTTHLSVGSATMIQGSATIRLTTLQNSTSRLYAGCATQIQGNIIIGAFDKPFEARYRENPTSQLSVSGLAIPRAGFGMYMPPTIPDDFADDEYDLVKLYFEFPVNPSQSVRAISLPNARADITREEIKEVGQYAVDNKIIMNEAGEYATKVVRAALKAKDIKKVF